MRGENLRILIVDDDATVAEAIRNAFDKAGNGAAIGVERTLAGYRQAVASDPPDIVLMGLELPDGNALDLLKSPEFSSPYPILVMAGQGSEKKAVKAIKAGAIDYVVKSQESFRALPRTIPHSLGEWELLKERRFNRDILACIDEAIAVIDRDYRILRANRAFCDRAGIRAEEVAGKSCREMFNLLARPCCDSSRDCPCRRTFETGESACFVTTVADAEGEPLHLETKIYPIKDRWGGVEAVIEIINDITEKTNLEAQLRHSLKMEAIGSLAGGIAHDFNNVLSAVIGYGHLALLKMGPDDPQREDVENILEGAERAAQLTKSLLVFSRKQVSEKGPVDINEIIRHVEKFLRRVIGDDVVLTVSLHGEALVVLADNHQLEQVMMNLATNARDAMSGGGDLIIGSKPVKIGKSFIARHGYGRAGRYALVTFSDTGAGMSGETLRKIFDPFFTTKDAGKGTGLGLSVVYGIIKHHEGFIDVYSEPGCGTSFKIYLPIISTELSREEESRDEKAPSRGSETILFADDDSTLRGLAKILLEKHGYRVIEADDGEEAVKRFMENREKIDILLFDLVMPKMNGKEAYNEIKQWRPDIKVIYSSGYAPEYVRQKMQMDSNEFLVNKPIAPTELVKAIRRVLDGGGSTD